MRQCGADAILPVAHPKGADCSVRAQTLKIEHARYVVTLDSTRRIVADGVDPRRGPWIRRVGKAADLADVPADRTIDARHLVVTPGFVNGHMHISYAHAVRGIFLDDLGSPLPYVFRLQMAMTEDEEYHTTLLGLVELLKSGTVCLRRSRQHQVPGRVPAGLFGRRHSRDSRRRRVGSEAPFPLRATAPKRPSGAPAAFLRTWNGRLDGRLRAWAMPFSPETCSADLLRGVKRAADEHGTGLTIHHGSGPDARRESVARHGLGPTQYLESVGVLGPNVLLAHAPGLDERRDRMPGPHRHGRRGVSGHERQGAEGTAQHGRMPELLEKGVRVALGSDSPNNSNHLDPVRTMNMAALQYKDARQDMRQIPAERALEMATAPRGRGPSGSGRRSARSSPASAPTSCSSTRSGPNGKPCSTRSTTSSTTPTAAACTPWSWTAASWWMPTARPSWTRRGSSPRPGDRRAPSRPDRRRSATVAMAHRLTEGRRRRLAGGARRSARRAPRGAR